MADTALVQEILQQVTKLNKPQQAQVLGFIHTLNRAPFDRRAWLKRANEMREKLIAERGPDFTVNVVELIDEAREERLNDIMGGQ